MARHAVIADIHSNLPALEAVLAHAGEVDGWLCAGDLVGYGPHPEACVARLRGIGPTVVGNHDLGSVGEIGIERFNRDARAANTWTAQVMSEEAAAYLSGLPMSLELSGDVLLVHGSPTNPIWEYVLTDEQALENLTAMRARVCFHGHSHVPAVFSLGREPGQPREIELVMPGDGQRIELDPARAYLLNVGSVGQPRDGDPRACYVIYDTADASVTYYRVPYPLDGVSRDMREAGLPSFLIQRLAAGR